MDGHQRSARARAARGVEGTPKRDRHVAVAHVLSNSVAVPFDPVSVLEGLEVLGYGRHGSRGLKRNQEEGQPGQPTKDKTHEGRTHENHKMNVNKKV